MPESTWTPRHNRWLIAVSVTLATFMEVLDTSIANVSLPHIAGGLSASLNEATWVLTCYLVSNAVILPASAYISSLMGRKRFYMTCVVLFGLSSLLCGFAPSLSLLLLFRVMQGIGGGGLAPSEQAILADTFPPNKRGQAFAVYGMAVVFAPAIGPTLGGWITDNFNWRWIFFINIPVAIVSLILTSRLVDDPPHVQKEVREARGGNFRLDYTGFALVALAFGCLEVVLDKGQDDDWFSSGLIRAFAILCALGFIALISWELREIRLLHRPILNLRLFLNRTFAVSFGMMFILGFALYATTVLIPQLLQTLMGYTAEAAGAALSFGGLTTMVCMPIVGRLIGKVDPRYLIMFGFGTMGLALIYMGGMNLLMSFQHAALMRVFQSLGLAFLFVPIQTMSYTDVPMNQNNDVSGLTNLARNIGGSCGTAFLVTMLARLSQRHQSDLATHVAAGDPVFMAHFNGLHQALVHAGIQSSMATQQTYGRLYGQVLQQASMLAYIDIVKILAVAALAMIPFAFLMSKRKSAGPAAVH
ncbi:MAG TPA: DHA2 family efflux MFS transporter permease subunit [Bryobacteraceae bacterium]|jgi:DHA2 family multidrug resistance protein|nr:DHA2 family efflux MFS transporter permease subunit [Bryobacteraceae bacterium]